MGHSMYMDLRALNPQTNTHNRRTNQEQKIMRSKKRTRHRDLRGSDLSWLLNRTPRGAGMFHYDESIRELQSWSALTIT